jgi:hypothetical protein
VAEWLKAPVLKTGVGSAYREFESHPIRQFSMPEKAFSNMQTLEES